MKIGLRGGHSPNCKGAIGILDEQVEVKKIYNELAPMLTNNGYTVIDCNSTAYTVSGELSDGTNKANSSYCDMYITIHMNASNGSGNGTECWLYNASNSTMNSIADRICSNFASHGFQNRGKKYNTGYHDLNASAMPAMIIETLFCDNSGDAGRYKSLGAKGIAALIANGIDNKIPVSAVSGWKTENGKKYYYIDGNKVQGEKSISGKWYYFNPKDNGAMVTGFCDLPGKKVYYDKDGAMVFGEKYISGKWYHFSEKDGAMTVGFCDLPTKRVYYDKDGSMVFGEKAIGGKWYYFNGKDGAMITGFYDLPEKRVYYGKDGQMIFGEQSINGKWYYFSTKDGSMVTGFYDLPEKRVYYGTDGAMVFGDFEINGDWYYFSLRDGAMVTGWKSDSNQTKYYDSNGKRVCGEIEIDGETYTFDDDGFLKI